MNYGGIQKQTKDQNLLLLSRSPPPKTYSYTTDTCILTADTCLRRNIHLESISYAGPQFRLKKKNPGVPKHQIKTVVIRPKHKREQQILSIYFKGADDFKTEDAVSPAPAPIELLLCLLHVHRARV